MTILKVYLLICLVWGIFAARKHRIFYEGSPYNSWNQCLNTFIVNFILCPYAIYVAIINKKL